MLKLFTKHIKGYEKDAIKSPLFIAIEAICELFLPLLMADIIDVGINGDGGMPFIWKAGLGMLALSVLSLYSGMTAADWDYLYEMFLLKYANKSSQTVFAGCTAHTEQTPVTVAGSGAPTVTIAKSVAEKWPIGSAVMVGTTTVANRDRGNADAHDIASQANIVAKTAAGDNVTLTLDCGPISTEVGQIVSTAPWNPGACIGLAGDGSPYDPKSGREPFMLQGMEVMLGAYEILGDQLAKCVAGGKWGMY